MILRPLLLVLAYLCTLATVSAVQEENAVVDKQITARRPAAVTKTKTVTKTVRVTTGTTTKTTVVQVEATVTRSTSTFTRTTTTQTRKDTLTSEVYVSTTITRTLTSTYPSSAPTVARAFVEAPAVTRTVTKTKTVKVASTALVTSTQTIYKPTTTTIVTTYHRKIRPYLSTTFTTSTSSRILTYTECAGKNPIGSINLQVKDLIATATDKYNGQYASLKAETEGEPSTTMNFTPAKPTNFAVEIDCANRLKSIDSANNAIYWVGKRITHDSYDTPPRFYTENYYIHLFLTHTPIYCGIDSGNLACFAEQNLTGNPINFQTCAYKRSNVVVVHSDAAADRDCTAFQFKVIDSKS